MGLAVVLSAPTSLTPLASAAAGGLGRPDVPTDHVASVTTPGPGAAKARKLAADTKAANQASARRAAEEQKAAWPAAQRLTGTIAKGDHKKLASLGVVPAKKRAAKQDKSPAQAAGTSTVEVLSQKSARAAGVTGVLFTAAAQTPGETEVSLNYGSFASVIGGDWSGRLGLLRYPACVLTDPTKEACRASTPVDSVNDPGTQTVSAAVTLSATFGSTEAPAVFALAATAPTSVKGSGDLKATDLSAASSWSAGASSGSFTWSEGLEVPKAAAGPAPSLSLSYDSGSSDGRTSNTNNQASLIGEGFSLTQSYVERSYGSCDDDGQDDKNDLCWKYDNASLVLNGKSTELVKDDTTGVWHLKDDDASQVFHLTGADNGDQGDAVSGVGAAQKGDGAGEYWKVVTGDGTAYTFGLNKLPGANDARTNSVLTTPVFGDDADEPGYGKGTSFDKRFYQQAWRWNLDLVQDVHGNASTSWYTNDTNYYAKNGDKTALASYTRASRPTEILYGQRADALFSGTTGTAKGYASNKVTFDYAERCTASDCSSLTEDTADNWPDVPFDAICADTATDCLATSPSFFTRKRLTGVNTFSWDAKTTAFLPVDSYSLKQHFEDGQDAGDTSDQVLALTSIQRTGKSNGEIALPAIQFGYTLRPNRVDTVIDGVTALSRPRMLTVTSETGAITTVTYNQPECVRSSLPAEDNSTTSCYPQKWNYEGDEDTDVDWFHKYRVTAVVTDDPAGSSSLEYQYAYSGAAWHFDDSVITPEKDRTWSDWRGYRNVTVTTGRTDGPQTKTTTVYMQGMNGDKRLDGTTRTATIPAVTMPGTTIAAVPDTERLAGSVRQTVTYNGTTPIGFNLNTYYLKVTATQHHSYADTEAFYLRPSTETAYTWLTATSAWRSTATSHTYDSYGMAATVETSGDQAKTGDETCTRTWYARNPDKGLTSLVSRVRKVARTCVDDGQLTLPTSSATRGDVLSDTATVYDNTAATGWSATQTPTLGLATWVGRPTGYPAVSGTADRTPTGWQTVSKTTYDTAAAKLGRPLTVTDAAGHTTTTAYTPADKGPVTITATTTPTLAASGQAQKSWAYFEPARGLQTRSNDANGGKTDATYDALGRTTATWLPNRTQTGGESANATYTYAIRTATPSATSVSTLNADGKTYTTTYSLYDSLLRPLQTQSPVPAPLTGRILTDTRYDSRGLAYETYDQAYDDSKSPDGVYAKVEYGTAGAQTNTAHDAAGRPTTTTFFGLTTQKWQTTATYTGDSTATTAPDGGNATRTITDALGRTTATRTYAGTTPADTQYGATAAQAASYTQVTSTSTLDGLPLTAVSEADASKWTYAYDLYGRQVSTTDPDKGATTTTYTALDQVDTTTDADKNVLLYTYDELGRKTDLWKTSRTDANKLAAWTFDTADHGKGLAAAATRYDGGVTGKAYTKTVTAYDTIGRAQDTTLTLPATDPLVTSGAVTATTAFHTAYKLDGTLNDSIEPAVAGLPKEVLEPTYNNNLGLTTGLVGNSSYLLDATYSALGQPTLLSLGTNEASKKAYIASTYETGTGRLLTSDVTDQTHNYKLQDLTYAYDQAGNVTSIADATTQGGTTGADFQCFAYDAQRRLTEAWTPTTNNCSAANRAQSNIGGPAPYWTSYTYNNSGQRSTEVTHSASGNTTTNYTYGTTAGQPHPLAKTTGATAATYTYDLNGNTLTRPGTQATQTLTWNAEDNLTTTAEPAAGSKPALNTSYLYDADGELLIRRATGDGDTVLYLGSTEVRLTTKGSTKTVTGTRYYSAAGQTIALRTATVGTAGTKLSFLAGDNHGTSNISLDSSTQAVTKRYTSPFGESRGTTAGAWPDDKAFLGKPADTTTGLTHIGAREYDPGIGQFISVDPVLDLADTQQLNGYSYAGNSPVTKSDPTGLKSQADRSGSSNLNGLDAEELQKANDSYDVGGSSGSSGNSDGGGGDGGDDCSWSCHLKGAVTGVGSVIETGWDNTTEWVDDNKVFLVQLGTEVVVGAGCYAVSGATAVETGGASLALATQCGAISGAAGAAVGNWMTPDADHSVTGVFGDMATGAVLGAAGGAGGEALSAAAPKIAKAIFGCHSFLPGTGVLLADGTHKAIEDVEVGDEVVTTDVETGKTTTRSVADTITTVGDKDFTEISIHVGKGYSSIVATDTHPFWIPELKKWVDAGNVWVGQWLRTSAGTVVQVTGVRHFTKPQLTHDLTITDIHAYYVLAGATPVLVHNCGTGPRDSAGLGPDELMSKAEGLRDEYAGEMAQLSNRKRPATVTAGYNSETGQYAAGASVKGVCAETCVVNQLGGDPSKIVFTAAVRPRTGALINICVACEGQFGRSGFKGAGTVFDSDVLSRFDQ
ncbi:RHS repeat-associated core domain-containing protein [Streptomyces sp. NPDC060184]|uniref:RHS repeat-associated core domain-containing protein n=1 Tax=Streptomyces sp. NPDC060184 TaxID=3347064 RepID=UPI00365C045B